VVSNSSISKKKLKCVVWCVVISKKGSQYSAISEVIEMSVSVEMNLSIREKSLINDVISSVSCRHNLSLDYVEELSNVSWSRRDVGRRGRPKKESVIRASGVSDLFARLTSDDCSSEVVEEKVSSNLSLCLSKEEVEEKKCDLEQKKTLMKSAKLEAKNLAKEQKKAILEAAKSQAKAEKLALKEAKLADKEAVKAAKKEAAEALKNEKAAKKEAAEALKNEKNEKKEALKNEKEAKKALKNEKKEAKKEAAEALKNEKAAVKAAKKEAAEALKNEKEAKKALKNEKKEAKKAEKESTVEPQEALKNEEKSEPQEKVKVVRVKIDGVDYFKSSSNIVYDVDTREEVGIYDDESKTIKPLPDDEEEEEEYMSDED